MTRLVVISTMLIACLAAGMSAILSAQAPTPAQVASAKPERPTKTLNLRVVDTQDRGVPDVEVKVFEYDAIPSDDGRQYRTAAYRTVADGRVRINVDARYQRLDFEARDGERAMGWANYAADRAWLKDNSKYPIILTILPRNHRVEGTIVDTRGTPIAGVRVRAVQFHHDTNGFATDYPSEGAEPRLAWAVTDSGGHYRLMLPDDTTVSFRLYHPRYWGSPFSCTADDRTIPAVTMEDAGAVAGTVTDAATGRPVAGAVVSGGCIEITARIGGHGGTAVSDAQGHFRIGGLAPGVYNVGLRSSPKGRRFLAREFEGVRVQAGREARAELLMVEGRRVHGTAVFAVTGEPVAGASIACDSRRGGGSQWTHTDQRGHFERFALPGPVLVYMSPDGTGPSSPARKTFIVPEDRDPEPVTLQRGYDPNARPVPPPQPSPPRECQVRVRVKTDPIERPAPGADRTLTGRIFDKNGSPLPAIRIDGQPRPMEVFGAATDRLGVFRLKGLPVGEVRIWLHKDDEVDGGATIPAGAVEVDLIVP